MKMNELTKYCLELADDTTEAKKCLDLSTSFFMTDAVQGEIQQENNRLKEKIETLQAKIDQLLGAEQPERITRTANDASVSYEQMKGLLRTWSEKDITFTTPQLASYFECSRPHATNMLKTLRGNWPEFNQLYKMEGERRYAKYVSRKHVPRITRIVAMGTPSGQAIKLEGSD